MILGTSPILGGVVSSTDVPVKLVTGSPPTPSIWTSTIDLIVCVVVKVSLEPSTVPERASVIKSSTVIKVEVLCGNVKVKLPDNPDGKVTVMALPSLLVKV